MIISITSFIALLALFAVILKIAFPLPDPGKIADNSISPDAPSALVDEAQKLASQHPEKSGLHLLSTGIDAFAMRMALVRNAKRTVDAQYYIWEGDLSGRMLLAEMIAAADRGVQVRILIDDNPTGGLDKYWSAATTHKNISVRIFNPLAIRKIRPLNYLFDFPRLNRRMHNKSLTVDKAATIIGGRNVGDVYFGAASEGLFLDLDALTIGPAVTEVVNDFQLYWDSEPAHSAELILSKPAPDMLGKMRDPGYEDEARAKEYQSAAIEALSVLKFDEPEQLFTWAPVQVVSDNPDKALNKAKRSDLLALKIAPLIAGAEKRFDMISGYFVPGEKGTALITGVANRGIPTRVVTNGIQVTDVPIVHAGYMPYRMDLLESGVTLMEGRKHAKEKTSAENLGHTKFSGGGESVHAKTFAIDDRLLFVGSFNFDPRSALLNCEMGFIIDSPKFAKALVSTLDERAANYAYYVSLDDNGDMQWTEKTDDNEQVFNKEPGTNGFERFIIYILSKLPIEWML